MVALSIIASGCGAGTQQEQQAKQDLRDSARVKAANFEGSMIYYSLPSPLELAYIVESSGVGYEPSILHKTELSVRYSTSRAAAVNLGIYGSDLSYSILFDQQQVALKYLGSIRDLASSLDISDSMSAEKLREMEDNIQDKEKLKKIVAQTFFHSDALLKENSRRPTAAMIIAGMWVEGMYIATQFSDAKDNANPVLVQCIAEQGLVFDDLKNMLGAITGSEDVAFIRQKLEKVGADYEDLRTSLGGSFIVSSDEIDIKTDLLKRICNDIKAVRTDFTELF